MDQAVSNPAEPAQSPLPNGHPPVRFGRIGVLLANLGSPSGTDYWSMRRYLKQFLWDRRVIEVARPVWWMILNGIVLSTRPQRSGEAYRTVWNNELDEAPLITITRAQAENLAERLAGDGVVVDWGMRYGERAIGDRLRAMKAAGCDRILIAPLYPQYAAATTATANDVAFEALQAMRWAPAIRTLPPYHDDPVYIDALADSVTEHLTGLPFEPEMVIASFHGLPQEYLDKGDPYHCQCQKTGRMLRDRLGWPGERFKVCFQSRVSKAEWLKPYFDVTIAELADDGLRRLAVIMPGFSADCLETLEEIEMQGAETFRDHGGEDYAAIPCLNDSDSGMRLIEHLVRRELSGWL
ncbi:MAG: ferrochelatase [Hyphomicrobiales bacterium]|nr:ferrochelatase [Hyphomicrobiales bacterium]